MNIIITGCSGQDGSYMADYLLENTDNKIYGMIRRSSKPDYSNLDKAIKNPRFQMVYGDLSDSQSIDNLVYQIKPNYFINFAAQSFVGSSWQLPEQTFDINAVGVIRCLEAIRKHVPQCRFYSAGSSEEFGDVVSTPQNASHPLRPRSPYGASKAAARHIVKVYRESYDIYAIQPFVFNHESPRRGEEFVTRKITKGIARIFHAIQDGKIFKPIELGNTDSRRDWSHSKDFIEGIWMILNQPMVNKEYVLSSNTTNSVAEFLETALTVAGIDYYKEQNIWFKKSTKIPLVIINPEFNRPADVQCLQGDSSEFRNLGWKPKYSFNDLVKEMVESDIQNFKE
jgi:GDPmannose 4,6-dehydratase